MRAFQVTDHALPPALVEIPAPRPAAGEVLLRIEACALNFADLLQSKGRYQEKHPLPVILGMEVAGVVESLGPGTAGPPPGTRVAVMCGAGGLAEKVAVPAEHCIPVPDIMPPETAAAFQIAYGTSHLALTRRAGLRAGETLLVLGAAGGVGLTAVEIGHALGATVIAAARGPEKLEIARAAGARHLIDTDTTSIRERVKALGGADVVYDPVGGAQFEEVFRATNPEGRILVIGFASGDVPPIPANHLLVKNISVHGLYWGGYARFRPEALTDSLAELVDWYAAGRLRPHISHVLPLERAAEGLELLRSRAASGKVVITP